MVNFNYPKVWWGQNRLVGGNCPPPCPYDNYGPVGLCDSILRTGSASHQLKRRTYGTPLIKKTEEVKMTQLLFLPLVDIWPTIVLVSLISSICNRSLHRFIGILHFTVLE